MIRFIDLTGQHTLDDDEFRFAWFSTITDKFLEFAGEQTFSSWADFLEAFKEHIRDDNPAHGYRNLSRFKSLYPKDRPVTNMFEFAEKLSGSRLLPWQIEFFDNLDKCKTISICLGRNVGKRWVIEIVRAYLASKAVGDFVQWAIGKKKKGQKKKDITVSRHFDEIYLDDMLLEEEIKNNEESKTY